MHLRDSKMLFDENDANMMWSRYRQDGYLLFRGLLPRESVLEVQHQITQLLGDGNLVNSLYEATTRDGWIVDVPQSSSVIQGTNNFDKAISDEETDRWKRICNQKSIMVIQCILELLMSLIRYLTLYTDDYFKDILRNEAMARVLDLLAEGKRFSDGLPCRSRYFHPYYTWLRIKAPGELTVDHADVFYFHVGDRMHVCPSSLSVV